MRVSNWNPQKYDQEFMSASMERLKKAAEVVAEKARQKCPVGTISRPIYGEGQYAGKPYTAREPGALKKTIRVVELKGSKARNIRVYAGNYDIFYARFVEYGTAKTAARPYLRPALTGSRTEIRAILENG
jgi:HK97 gp10 family phage protein